MSYLRKLNVSFNLCIDSALKTSGNAMLCTFNVGYSFDAIPSMISQANAALMNDASSFTLCLHAK